MTNSKLRNRLFILVLVFTVFAIVLAKPVYNIIINQENQSMHENIDYKNLFKKDEWQNFQLYNTIESKHREFESQYIYKKAFNVFVTKIHTDKFFDLSRNLEIEEAPSIRDSTELYFLIRSFGSEISLKSIALTPVTSIKLKIESSHAISVTKTSNTRIYDFDYQTFSVIFDKDQYYMVSKAIKSRIFASIAFIAKNNVVYIVLMTPADKNVKVQPGQLVDLLTR